MTLLKLATWGRTDVQAGQAAQRRQLRQVRITAGERVHQPQLPQPCEQPNCPDGVRSRIAIRAAAVFVFLAAGHHVLTVREAGQARKHRQVLHVLEEMLHRYSKLPEDINP